MNMEREYQSMEFVMIPLAISTLFLISVGWIGHAVLKRTPFHRAARLAHRTQRTAQQMHLMVLRPSKKSKPYRH